MAWDRIMYSLIRSLLFCLDAEVAHQVALSLLTIAPKMAQPQGAVVEAMGLVFPNVVGLAAGFDKNGAYLSALEKLGFGFIEVGTVTPKPQAGNPKPRVFRLSKAHALINRMGFNNAGVDALVANVIQSSYKGILGINIGKNKDTPMAKAIDDYSYCLHKAYQHASYITINISSPNTPDLRKLQHGEYFKELINHLREEQLQLADKHQKYVPLVVKLSPDEDDEALKQMVDVMVSVGIDGVIATNTTASRKGVEHLPHQEEAGGLSGRPLMSRSTECLRLLKQVAGDELTIIGVGGIDDVTCAHEKLKAGATLLQVYTGLIYQGPGLIKKLILEKVD